MKLSRVVVLLVLFLVDITGTWKIVLEGTTVPSTATLELVQKKDVVTGTYTGRAGQGQILGRVNGKYVNISVEAGGRSLLFDGQLDKTNRKIVGTYFAPQRGTGAFQASKTEVTKGKR